MRAKLSSSSLVLMAVVACSRPQNEPTPPREAPAPSAQTSPSSTSTTSGSPGPAPPPAPNVAPASAVAEKLAGPPREGCDGLFDPPAGAVKLCDEHTLGSGAEIRWTSWAVKTSRMDVFRLYEQRAGACSASSTSKPPLLSVSKGDARLSIHDANESGYPSCAAKPAPDRPTVVVISTKHDRR